MAKTPSAKATAAGIRKAGQAVEKAGGEPHTASGAAAGPPMPLSLQVRLGSIAVHADELLSDDGHAFDRVALKDLLQDAELREWIAGMGALLPLKRKLEPQA